MDKYELKELKVLLKIGRLRGENSSSYKDIYNKPFCKDNIKDLENEEWKEIRGTDSYYLISNMGRVKSL